MTDQAARGSFLIACEGLQALVAALKRRGYRVMGPTLRDEAIVYDEIAGIEDLPRGWSDVQEPGRYRLRRRDDAAVFGYAVGPHSWKRFLHPPAERLWQARKNEGQLTFETDRPAQRFAFLGVRSCEIRAIEIQDKVFLGSSYRDLAYGERRKDNFIVAVHCGEPGGSCFCVSMQAGPRASGGYDLALTELLREESEFLVEIGSDAGAALLAEIPHRAAAAEDLSAAGAVTARAETRMGRNLQTDGLKDVLQANPDHPHWDDVAARCLSCANCTMVCPTCFCTTVEDHTDLAGETATRERKWDSCFTLDFSAIHGGSARTQTRARYRQWLTHKLAHWFDQFGTSGCVGCGRCITWCPVGIDITAEATAIRAKSARTGDAGGRP